MKYQKPFLAVVCIRREGAVSKQDRFRSNASGFYKLIFCIWTRADLKIIMLVVATCLSDGILVSSAKRDGELRRTEKLCLT